MQSSYSEDDFLYLSGIQHFAFCKRQWALIHIEQQWAENLKTTEGNIFHERTHNPRIRTESMDRVVTRSMYLKSKKLGLYGMADIVEFSYTIDQIQGIKIEGKNGFWKPRPIEYKRGKPKTDDIDNVQLCAQAICLEEMLNISISSGSLFYGETKRRLEVKFTNELRTKVLEFSSEMHGMFNDGKTPLPYFTKKCNKCSLLNLCNPKISNRAKNIDNYIERMLKAKENNET
jgi:CRISPR-associated exonuclease Cas4